MLRTLYQIVSCGLVWFFSSHVDTQHPYWMTCLSGVMIKVRVFGLFCPAVSSHAATQHPCWMTCLSWVMIKEFVVLGFGLCFPVVVCFNVYLDYESVVCVMFGVFVLRVLVCALVFGRVVCSSPGHPVQPVGWVV